VQGIVTSGEKMKIIGISGSPRGSLSQTLRLVNAVLAGAEQAGAETEFVDICFLDIQYCIGCGVCYTTGGCIHADEFGGLFQKMLESDGIVIGSPVYINSVTAQLKTVLDRMADAIHCQQFTGKYACAVSTAGGSHADEVVAYLNSVMRILGATTVGGVGVILSPDPSAIIAAETDGRELGKTMVSAIREQKKYPDQEIEHRVIRERMKSLVACNKDIWMHEYAYWTEMGW
jgi:multimeric flavodoxin WrbA